MTALARRAACILGTVKPATPAEAHGDLDDATLRSYATAVAVAWAAFGGMHFVGGRPITAAAHVAAALLSLGARVLVRPSAGIRTLPILTLACGSLAGLGAAAVLSADPRGPAVTLLALVPLLTGVVRARRLRRGIFVLAIATSMPQLRSCRVTARVASQFRRGGLRAHMRLDSSRERRCC